jgi:hypothetical protein
VSEKISFQNANGKRITGLFHVSKRMVTVAAPEGRTRAANIEESMLDPQTLARVLGRSDRKVDPRRGPAHCGEHRQAAGAARPKIVLKGRSAGVSAANWVHNRPPQVNGFDAITVICRAPAKCPDEYPPGEAKSFACENNGHWDGSFGFG